MGIFTHLYQLTTWKKLRRAHLRQNPFCVYCLEHGYQVVGNTVDHKKPHRGDMGLFVDPANLQTLCHSCHSKTKQLQERHGYAPGATEEGLPLDPRHPWNASRTSSVQKEQEHRGEVMEK
jgi:hypothetical protein